MKTNDSRIKVSILIEYYQRIEFHLEGIYASICGKSFFDGIDDVENLSLTRLVKELRQTDMEREERVLKDQDYENLLELCARRNFWCHNGFVKMPFDSKNGYFVKKRDRDILEKDIKDAEMLSKRVARVSQNLIKQKYAQTGELPVIRVAAAVIARTGENGEADVFATQRGYGDYKDWWEFPGGKIKEGESPREALVREIREELDADINVGRLIATVEYDYPKFHLSMDCFWCSLKGDHLTLLEHKAARWLPLNDLKQVKWLPADLTVVEKIEKRR
jgi:8-oxo-dGTP diphosphatase